MQLLRITDQVDFLRRYTLEEFWALPERKDGARYELIEGYLYLVPPPDPAHAELMERMARALNQFLNSNNIDGEVHFPNEPITRRSEDSTDLQSDLM
jgi:Uma2 family endonuclease